MYVVLLYIVIHTDIKICFVEPNGCCEYCELNNQPKVLLSFDSSDMSYPNVCEADLQILMLFIS